jgi:hypothetical protein
MNWVNARWFGFQPLMVLPTIFLGLVAIGHVIRSDWGAMLVMGAGSVVGVIACMRHREVSTPA